MLKSCYKRKCYKSENEAYCKMDFFIDTITFFDKELHAFTKSSFSACFLFMLLLEIDVQVIDVS